MKRSTSLTQDNMTSKRKREVESSSGGPYLLDSTPDNSEANRGLEPSSNDEGTLEIVEVTPRVLLACRTALMKGPAACRAALDKHRAAIDSELAMILEDVGGYEIKVPSTNSSTQSLPPPLHRHPHSSMLQYAVLLPQTFTRTYAAATW